MRAAIASAAALALGACVAPVGEMQRAVEDYGFRDVRLEGAAWWGCSDKDTFARKWSGRNVAGRPVRGVVCGGLGKDWTVRITGRGA